MYTEFIFCSFYGVGIYRLKVASVLGLRWTTMVAPFPTRNDSDEPDKAELVSMHDTIQPYSDACSSRTTRTCALLEHASSSDDE